MASALSNMSSARLSGGIYTSRRSAGIAGNQNGLKVGRDGAIETCALMWMDNPQHVRSRHGMDVQHCGDVYKEPSFLTSHGTLSYHMYLDVPEQWIAGVEAASLFVSPSPVASKENGQLSMGRGGLCIRGIGALRLTLPPRSFFLWQFNKGSAVVTMRKKDIHPEWFQESKVNDHALLLIPKQQHDCYMAYMIMEDKDLQIKENTDGALQLTFAWSYRSLFQVICNGEEVMTLGGTREEYVVDIWSGNHPFFQGNTSAMVVDEGRVNRFARR